MNLKRYGVKKYIVNRFENKVIISLIPLEGMRKQVKENSDLITKQLFSSGEYANEFNFSSQVIVILEGRSQGMKPIALGTYDIQQ